MFCCFKYLFSYDAHWVCLKMICNRATCVFVGHVMYSFVVIPQDSLFFLKALLAKLPAIVTGKQTQ